MYYLGVDAGTSKIKAAIVDRTGRQVDMESLKVDTIHPFHGASEMDMNELWHMFCKITAALAERNPGIWSEIEGIGIAGQGDGLWAIDAEGEPVRNAILWNDTRTKGVDIDRSHIDNLCVENASNVIYAGAWHILLRWLKDNEYGHYESVETLLHCKDWLNYKLTGVYSTDYTDASTALLNIETKEYVDEVIDALGIQEKRHVFPKPAGSGEIIGRTTERAFLETGLPEGIPVIAGAIDVAAVAIGLGVKEIGEACTIIGTTMCNEMVLEKEYIDLRKNMAICHMPEGRYLSVMPTLNGTTAIDWIKGLLFRDTGFGEMDKMLADVPVGSRGILFLPYLYGERSPFRNAYATGNFSGLSAVHEGKDMCRAVYEGLGLNLLECYRSLPPVKDSIAISGGGAASDVLCTIVADCLNKQVHRPEVQELGILGIATAIAESLGKPFAEQQKSGSSGQVFHPDPCHHEIYLEMFDKFNALRHNMEEFWQYGKDRVKTC